jgi:hypothetical protein
MLWLLLALAGVARAVYYQVEFRDALWVDRLNNATFCVAMNATLGGVTDCASFWPLQQSSILMSAVQINVYNASVDVYAPGNTLASMLTTLLQNGGFFTLSQSSVTQITLIERPTVLAVSVIVLVIFVSCMSALAIFLFPKETPRRRSTRLQQQQRGVVPTPPRAAAAAGLRW